MYAALTELYSEGGDLQDPPTELTTYFNELRLARIAKESLEPEDVVTRGKAVLVTAGPPALEKAV